LLCVRRRAWALLGMNLAGNDAAWARLHGVCAGLGADGPLKLGRG
jgi:hypothetical protein